MKKKILMCIVWISLFAILTTSVYAANTTTSTPSLVTKVTNAFTKIQKYLVKISVPIAGVCIICGILIRKLSFGDEQKAVLGKRMIINSIVGYAAIQSIELIIKFIDSVMK